MTPAPDTDRTDPQGDGLREEIAEAIGNAEMENGDDLDPGILRHWIPDGTPRIERANLLAAADAVISGPLAQLRSDLRAAEAERDEAQDLADKRLDLMWMDPDAARGRAMIAEANLIALAKMYGEACGELQVLRGITCDSAAAIGNGAYIGPECSLEFMSWLPKEIGGVTDKLRAERDGAREEIAAVERALEGLEETPLARRVGHWIGLAAEETTRANAAEAERDLLRTRVGEMAEAHRASQYLSGLYQRCWLGQPVRDLAEAEAAYASALAALKEREG